MAGLVAGLEPAAPLAKPGALQSLGADLRTLRRHPLFVLNLLAYCPVQAAFGAFTFWGPKARTAPALACALMPNN
jgi:hypothetical protein